MEVVEDMERGLYLLCQGACCLHLQGRRWKATGSL